MTHTLVTSKDEINKAINALGSAQSRSRDDKLIVALRDIIIQLGELGEPLKTGRQIESEEEKREYREREMEQRDHDGQL